MDKCKNEDKAHEVNTEMKVSDNILKERIGKICYAHKLIVELMYFMYNYFCNLVIDIRATKLLNEGDEAKRDDKVDMGTCEVSGRGSELLGKTGYVVCISLHISVSVSYHSKLA